MAALAAEMLLKTTTTTKTNSRDHVLIFPFMAKGHTVPLLHLSANLADRGVKVTLLTTLGNSPFIEDYLALPRPKVKLAILPFPENSPSIPLGCESTDSLPSFDLHSAFLIATKLLEHPFRRLLKELSDSGDLPLCVVSDFFFGWTRPACAEFGLPRLVFHGMGTFAMFLCKYIVTHQPHRASGAATEGFQVPGTPETLRFMVSDVPYQIRAPETSSLTDFIVEIGIEEMKSWGVVINSFAELESRYIEQLEAFYGHGNRAWLVGPMSLYPAKPSPFPNGAVGSLDDSSIALDPCLQWLDGKAPQSVVYVSFGTQANVSDEQLNELGYGLEMSGYDFIWVVRSPSWEPSKDLLDRLEKRRVGLLHRGWAPQREVLNHLSTGGFVSHCGWNSVLEGMSAGVPILAWPMVAEQPLNARFVVDVVKVALRVDGSGETTLVGRAAVCDGVRELMGRDKGKQAREKAAELGKVARVAMEEAGSSVGTLDRLLHELRAADKQI